MSQYEIRSGFEVRLGAGWVEDFGLSTDRGADPLMAGYLPDLLSDSARPGDGESRRGIVDPALGRLNPRVTHTTRSGFACLGQTEVKPIAVRGGSSKNRPRVFTGHRMIMGCWPAFPAVSVSRGVGFSTARQLKGDEGHEILVNDRAGTSGGVSVGADRVAGGRKYKRPFRHNR